jgi:hypothetical protein
MNPVERLVRRHVGRAKRAADTWGDIVRTGILIEQWIVEVAAVTRQHPDDVRETLVKQFSLEVEDLMREAGLQ